MMRIRKREHGFTVLEFVYASVILLIVAMGVMAVFTYSVQSSQSSSTKVDALNLANERIELIRNLPYDDVGLEDASGEPVDIPGSVQTPDVVGDYTVDTAVRWSRDPDTGRAEYKIVDVTVAWTTGLGGEVTISSNVYGKSDLVNTGDISVTVLDYDTSEPIENARVTITPSTGTARALRTSENGEAFFGYLATGEYTVAVDYSGYIYDYVDLSTLTVAPDLLSSFVVRMQLPSTVRVTVTNAGGDPISDALVTLRRPDVPNQTLYTDVNGVAEFGNLLVANYTVTVEKSGYGQGSADAIVSDVGQTADVLVTMAPRNGLVVRAQDESGVAMAGVTVEVRGPSPATGHAAGSPSTTASNGEASFDSLVNGSYTITVTKTGFSPQTTTVAYDGSSVTPVTFTMTPILNGSLRVRTVNSSGNGKGYEYIRITGPDGYLLIARTDSSGYYTVTGLAPGSYTIQSDWDGSRYNRTYNNIVISAGMQTYKEVRA